MLDILNNVFRGAAERLQFHITTYLPSLLAGLTILAVAWAGAAGVRWVIYRIFKGLAIDRFLRQSGVAFMIDRSGRLRATRLVAESAYWGLLAAGALMGLNVFNTHLTTQIIEGFVFLLPKLVLAGAILIAGLWLSQYLGRGLLVWAVNEELPSPRRLAALARVVIMFVAVVVAADQLNFARTVFLAAFIMLVGGAVLAASLWVGLNAGGGLKRLMEEKKSGAAAQGEPAFWNHL